MKRIYSTRGIILEVVTYQVKSPFGGGAGTEDRARVRIKVSTLEFQHALADSGVMMTFLLNSSYPSCVHRSPFDIQAMHS